MIQIVSLYAAGEGYPGHLWFVEHLLLYAVLYTAWRRLTARWSLGALPVPGNAAIFAYAVVLAVVTSVVRIECPISKTRSVRQAMQQPGYKAQHFKTLGLGHIRQPDSPPPSTVI